MAFRDLFSIRKPADSPPADSPPQEVPLQKLEWESAKIAPVVIPQQPPPLPPAGKAHAGAAFAPLPEMGGDPLFQIFVLGTRSAGKTVLLASLYRLLTVQDPLGNNFRLICKDFKSQKQLDDTFSRIANRKQDWPPGSTGIDEYIFDCVHTRARRDIPLFKFRYFDFPGGFISDARTPQELEFILNQVRIAHSILVLLDGKKIKNAIEDIESPADEPSLFQDLDMLTRIAQNCIGKPMHFAVTKYDILSPERHPLSLIKKTLLEHHGFRSIIAQQKTECPVHLLPVSAVGDRFAAYDPATQQMKKLPNGLIEPTRVDLSVTFTIVDYLTMIAAQRSKELAKKVEDDSSLRGWFLDKMRLLLSQSSAATGSLLTVGTHLLNLTSITNPVVQVLISGATLIGVRAMLETGAGKLGEVVVALAKETEEAQTKIKDQKSAAEAVLKIQMLMAQRFKAEFPDSNFA
jgi:hypothetical protein